MEIATAFLFVLIGVMCGLFCWFDAKTTENWRSSYRREQERQERLDRLIGVTKDQWEEGSRDRSK